MTPVCELCRERPATWAYRMPGDGESFLVCEPGHAVALQQWDEARFSQQLDIWFGGDGPEERAALRLRWLALFAAVRRGDATWEPVLGGAR